MSALANSMPVTGTRQEAVETAKVAESAEIDKDGKESKGKYLENLAQVQCIRYTINFGKKSVSTFFDSGSKANTIHLAFAKELGLTIKSTDVKAQKIAGTMLETYGMIVATFLVKNKVNQVRFFEETFLVANVSPEVVFWNAYPHLKWRRY